jgi:mannose-6-phosphate isomerase-like protein (cupin superfamily)
MPMYSLADFTEKTKADGYDGVSIREWDANAISQTHTHEFAVHAVIAQGEMWLTRGNETEHLQVGDTFTMDPDTPHAEKYGPQGTVYWAARRFSKI